MIHASDVYQAFQDYACTQGIDGTVQWQLFEAHLVHTVQKKLTCKQVVQHVKEEGVKGVMRLPKHEMFKKVWDSQIVKYTSAVAVPRPEHNKRQKHNDEPFFKSTRMHDKRVIEQLDRTLESMEKQPDYDSASVACLTHLVQCLQCEQLKRELQVPLTGLTDLCEPLNETGRYAYMNHINRINDVLLRFQIDLRNNS
jgi:hypothetical protein